MKTASPAPPRPYVEIEGRRLSDPCGSPEEHAALQALLTAAGGWEAATLSPYETLPAGCYASNGMDSLYIVPLLGNRQAELFCEQGWRPSSLRFEWHYSADAGGTVRTVAEVIRDWDLPEDTCRGELLVEWGQDGLAAEEVATPDYLGPCWVWRQPHYYPGTANPPAPGRARDEEGRVIEFATFAAADRYRSEYFEAPSGYDGIPACQVLSHGQASADSLTIIQA